MTSFMGPMAPPPAAPPQPQALDIRTDPNQRQQFKQFMKRRTSMAPMVSVPIAQPQPPMPMMQPPMPMPMGQDIDIFNPVNLHEGGIVPSLNSLQQQAAQFAEQLQGTVMGGGSGGGMSGGMGGGFGGSFSSGASVSPPTSTMPYGNVPTANMVGSISTPPISGGSSVLQPNPNARPDTGPVDPYRNPLNTRPGGSFFDVTGMPGQVQPGPIKAYIGGPQVDQGFFDSQEYNDFSSGPQVGTQDMYNSRYFGQMGSGSLGRSQENAYENYLRRTGQEGSIIQPNPFKAYTGGGGTPIDGLDMGVQMPPGFTPLPPGELGFTEDFGPLQAYMGGSSTFDESAPYNPDFFPDQRPQPLSYGLPGGPTYGFEDGGAVPPRRTDIRGQDHMLSYITPDEADILKALGGSGEAGPMGIPAFRPGGDDGQGNVGGDAPGGGSSGGGGGGGSSGGGGGSGNDDDGGGGIGTGDDPADDMDGPAGGDTSGDMGPDSASGGMYGGSFSDDVTDDASDDDMGDVGTMDGPSYSGPDDTDSTEVATDQESMGFDVFDSIEDFNQQQQEQQQQQQQQQKRAELEKAVKAGMLISTRTGKPVNTLDPVTGKVSGQVMSGTKAEQAAAKAAFDELQGLDKTGGIASVSGVPTDPLSSSKKGLLGLNPQDLLAIENFSYAPPAQTNVSLSRNPSSFTGKASAPSSFTDPLSEMFGYNMAPSPEEVALAASVSPVADTSAVASAPSSNVLSDFSPTPADQLDKEYGMPAGYFAGLNDLVDDQFSDIGNRPGAMSSDLSAALGVGAPGTGYTDQGLPVGLEFGTNPQTGAQITTNLAGLTEQQKADQPFSMDIAQAIGSNPYGYEIDPQTGQVIGQVGSPPFGMLGGLTTLAQNLFMGPPQDTQDLIERGAYTGMTGQGGGGEGGDGSDQPVKAPTDPCPDGFVMKNGACTPIDTGSGVPNQIGGIGTGQPPPPPASVIVPSPRQPVQSNLQGPVGYGSPIAGQAAPSVASNAAIYQQMLNQQALAPRAPLRLANGGSVSSNLDMAADNFLKALMPAA